MPINEDISDIPRAQKKASRYPSSKPIVVNVVAEAWYQKYLDDQRDVYAPAIPKLPFRLSLVGNRCDRQLYYNLAGVEQSTPPTIADAWRWEIGHYVGDGVAEHLGALGAGWFAEWVIDLRSIGIEGSAHADVVQLLCVECGGPMTESSASKPEHHPLFHHIDDETGFGRDAIDNELVLCRQCSVFDTADTSRKIAHEWRCEYVVEIKSKGGFPFKKATTDFKGAAEGPQYGDILQGAIAAWALGCDKMIVGYFGIENISPELARRFSDDEVARFAGEWHFSIPALMEVLEAERERINRLLRFVDPAVNILPVREIHDTEHPVGAVVINPKSKGHWVVRDADENVTQTGTYFICNGYCPHVDRCQSEGESAEEDQSDVI